MLKAHLARNSRQFIYLSRVVIGLGCSASPALASAKSTYYFNVATEQLRSMSERLQTTHGRERDVLQAQWNEQSKTILPQGHGVISGNPPTFILTIYWGKNINARCDRDTIGQSGCIRTVITLREPF